ncbi:hypothetical protein AWB74_07596 [Caballeronia arvi]|uniref:Uncharacterized protein n=1 Tax=Caballeronia arvi TaxID=1777135 RepID=A0A158KYE1_9BURK|nr:hypothetical protein AWB74_07596 [Caballeronia arvi]
MHLIIVRLGRIFTLVVAGPISILIAEAACPTYVELPTGTVFDIARMVDDSGSPSDALAQARADVAQVNAFGGCARLEHSSK